ncbi:MAG: hypothetical protein IJJ78_07195 [Paludibacteraceae bacterium]|nr:hypothetical protein [Paludibacteraceae bacterium]MBR0498848.1 hypothetical protein [Paludibacteraceae bacterium]
MKIKNLISIIALAISTVCASAQVPDAMRFQTVLRDANGLLMSNKQVGIRLTIEAKKGSNTTDLYAETFTTTTSLDGVATVVFGEGDVVNGNTYSSFAAIDWNTAEAERWMKVEIDPNGGSDYSMISGESQLLSAPYAMMANKAKVAESVEAVNAVGDLPISKVTLVIETEGDNKDNLKIPTVTISGKQLANGESVNLMAYTPIYVSVDYPDGAVDGRVFDQGSTTHYVDYSGEFLFNGKKVYQPIYGVVLKYLELQIDKDGDGKAYYDNVNPQITINDPDFGKYKALYANSNYKLEFLGADGSVVGSAAYNRASISGKYDVGSVGGYGIDLNNMMVGPVLLGDNVLKIKLTAKSGYFTN